MSDIKMNKQWYESVGPSADTVVSSRIRIARNLRDSFFPTKLAPSDQLLVNRRIRDAFYAANCDFAKQYLDVDLESIDPIERALLVEKRLVSRDLVRSAHPVEALIRRDEEVSIMLGEEDHLRIQAMSAGLELDKPYQEAESLAILFEELLDIAYDEQQGFLSSCPSNVGTGMRASLMLHLPALSERDQIPLLASQLEKLGMVLRGAHGEGSKGSVCFYQISNQISLGLSEDDLIADLLNAAGQTIEYERRARENLLSTRRLEMEDRLYRSRGILENARMLSNDEAGRLLSDLRWGVSMAVFKDLDLAMVSALLNRMGPAALQKEAGQILGAAERDERRATIVRESLRERK